MPPRPGIGPFVAMESAFWAWLTLAVASSTRATTLASRKREIMLGKLLGKREIGGARFGRRGTLGDRVGGRQESARFECRTRVTRDTVATAARRSRWELARGASGHEACRA